MIVYRDASREESTEAKLRRLFGLARRGEATAFLVEAGELEQGVVDAIRPQRDGWGSLDRRLREVLLAAGSAFTSGAAGGTAAPHLRRACEALERMSRRPDLPGRVRVKPPEGYVHYALDPAGYAAASVEYRAEVGRERAARSVVLGVRSIGTSLSAVVAATIGSARTATIRPRGETGYRHIAAELGLEAQLAAWLAEGVDVLVVDEGPGATGETLAAVAKWLRGLGVGDERVVLLASRAWGMPLAPESRRTWFDRARKHVPPNGDARPALLAARLGLSGVEDLSAGQWREVVPEAAEEPACVGHERCKYRARDAAGTAYLLRYAGLGRWGEAVADRAAVLAGAGAGAPVVAFSEGFLALRWTEGRPLDGRAGRDGDFLAALASYLTARAGRFRTGAAAEPGPVVELLLQNAGEALGPAVPGLASSARRLERLPRSEAVVPDARVHPREWLRTADGYRKVDALDHGDGLRFPGPTDAAWDVAGAAVEFDLDDSATSELARRQSMASGEDPLRLTDAAVAYRAPYAACALADATLSAREAPAQADRRRFGREAARYRAALARELRRAA